MSLLPPWEDLIVSGCVWKDRKGRDLKSTVQITVSLVTLSGSRRAHASRPMVESNWDSQCRLSRGVFQGRWGQRVRQHLLFAVFHDSLHLSQELSLSGGSALQPSSLLLGISFHRFFSSFLFSLSFFTPHLLHCVFLTNLDHF